MARPCPRQKRMKLYKLTVRAGWHQQNITPWIGKPEAGELQKVPGWIWSEARQKWLPTKMDQQIVYLPAERPARPTKWPHPYMPDIVEGWQWDEPTLSWHPTKMKETLIYVDRERPPSPAGPPREEVSDIQEGWCWSYPRETWVPLPMDTVIEWVTPERPPAPRYGPARAGTTEVTGWRWSEERRTWVPVSMEPVMKEVEKPRPPRPTEIPRPADPKEVYGWQWSSARRKWVETVLPKKPIWIEKERPPMPISPPGEEIREKVFGWHWDGQRKEWLETILPDREVVIEVPRWPDPNKIYKEQEAEIVRAGIYEEVMATLLKVGLEEYEAKRFIRAVVESGVLEKTVRPGGWAVGVIPETIKAFQAKMPTDWPGMTPTQYAACVAVALAVAAVYICWPKKGEDFYEGPIFTTYIMGEEYQQYAHLIGVSPGGTPYFYGCGETGGVATEHIRDLGWPNSKQDSFIFGEGFVEEGWQRGQFQRYDWVHWDMEFKGFLKRAGANTFSLQHGYEDPEEFVAGWTLPESQWYIDHIYYL